MEILAKIIMVAVVFVFTALMMGSLMGLASMSGSIVLADVTFNALWLVLSGFITALLSYFMFKFEEN
jgi:hypothetical protein